MLLILKELSWDQKLEMSQPVGRLDWDNPRPAGAVWPLGQLEQRVPMLTGVVLPPSQLEQHEP